MYRKLLVECLLVLRKLIVSFLVFGSHDGEHIGLPRWEGLGNVDCAAADGDWSRLLALLLGASSHLGYTWEDRVRYRITSRLHTFHGSQRRRS